MCVRSGIWNGCVRRRHILLTRDTVSPLLSLPFVCVRHCESPTVLISTQNVRPIFTQCTTFSRFNSIFGKSHLRIYIALCAVYGGGAIRCTDGWMAGLVWLDSASVSVRTRLYASAALCVCMSLHHSVRSTSLSPPSIAHAFIHTLRTR